MVEVVPLHDMEMLRDFAGNETAIAAHMSERSMCNCDPEIVHMVTPDRVFIEPSNLEVYEIWARGDCPFHGWAGGTL